MKMAKISREKLYRREYQRDSIQEFTGSVSEDNNIQESISRVVTQMIMRG